MKNLINYTVFGSSLIPENDVLFKKSQILTLLENWKVCSHIHVVIDWIPLLQEQRKKDLHRILFLTPLAKKHCIIFVTSAFVLLL